MTAVDLSHLAGKGVFVSWKRDGVFGQVKLTGKRPEDVFTGPGHQRELSAAWERARHLQPPGKIPPLA